MEKNCATKEAEWAEISKMRSLEMVAIADTIKILNDDDALEMFTRGIPGNAINHVPRSAFSSLALTAIRVL